MSGFRQFSVAEYHRLIDIGMITEDDNLELLEGYLVLKMGKNPPHECGIDLANDVFSGLKPKGWIVRIQEAITLDDSEPEPDLLLARGTPRTYAKRHPRPADIGLVVEVADSSLPSDRADKTRIYGRAGIACYWIINVQDGQVEVYTSPSGATTPGYARRQVYLPGDVVPFSLDGVLIADIAAHDLLP